jgi:hypothetical protein
MYAVAKFKIYLLVILYNVYLLTSLAKGYTIDKVQVEKPLPVTHFAVMVDPPAEQPLLTNDSNELVFKTQLNQVKKDNIIPTTQFFNLRTYIFDNNLHYNIPLICYKYAVSQNTADG